MPSGGGSRGPRREETHHKQNTKICRFLLIAGLVFFIMSGLRMLQEQQLIPAPAATSDTPNSITHEQPAPAMHSKVHANIRDDLPTCEQLMQHPSSPFADGAFLTRTTTPVVWKMRHDGSRELTLPSTCRLKHYTARDARQCFNNQNLLFLGDSLTRYQYLSLAYFLEYNKWPPRFQALNPCNHIDEHGNRTCSKQDEPNVCAEGDWIRVGGWSAYTQSLGGSTDGGIFHGRLEAQSLRDEPKIENMQYVSRPEEGGRTKLSYVIENGWRGQELFPPGWKFTGCAYNASCRYSPEHHAYNMERNKAKDYDWNYSSIMDAFGANGTSFQEQHADTNFVFYNRGLWGKLQEDKANSMMALLHNFTSDRCFFKSTTSCGRTIQNDLFKWEEGPIRRAAFNNGCEFMDVGHLTKEFSTLFFAHPQPPRNLMFEYHSVFWDAVHYQPWVYEELNNMLLNIMCNGKVLE